MKEMMIHKQKEEKEEEIKKKKEEEREEADINAPDAPVKKKTQRR